MEFANSWRVHDGHRLQIEFRSTVPVVNAEFPVERFTEDGHIIIYRGQVDWRGIEVSDEVKEWVYSRIEMHFLSDDLIVDWDDYIPKVKVEKPTAEKPKEANYGCLANMLVRIFGR
jgi:hypothetical protein